MRNDGWECVLWDSGMCNVCMVECGRDVEWCADVE